MPSISFHPHANNMSKHFAAHLVNLTSIHIYFGIVSIIYFDIYVLLLSIVKNQVFQALRIAQRMTADLVT